MTFVLFAQAARSLTAVSLASAFIGYATLNAAFAQTNLLDFTERVCVVRDFNLNGCKKGDTILYIPKEWGNEQLPVNFAAQFCHFNKQIVWTNGGVSCVYAGQKNIVYASDEVLKQSYSEIYTPLTKNHSGWTRFNDQGHYVYWRVVEKGNGGNMKEGDKVRILTRNCIHDTDGSEHPEPKFSGSNTIDRLNADYWIFNMQVPYGSVIESVGWNMHQFYKYEKVGR